MDRSFGNRYHAMLVKKLNALRVETREAFEEGAFSPEEFQQELTHINNLYGKGLEDYYFQVFQTHRV